MDLFWNLLHSPGPWAFFAGQKVSIFVHFGIRRQTMCLVFSLHALVYIWVALQIQDRSQKSRPVSSLNQSQTQMTRPVATGLALQRAPVVTLMEMCCAKHILRKWKHKWKSVMCGLHWVSELHSHGSRSCFAQTVALLLVFIPAVMTLKWHH